MERGHNKIIVQLFYAIADHPNEEKYRCIFWQDTYNNGTQNTLT